MIIRRIWDFIDKKIYRALWRGVFLLASRKPDSVFDDNLSGPLIARRL